MSNAKAAAETGADIDIETEGDDTQTLMNLPSLTEGAERDRQDHSLRASNAAYSIERLEQDLRLLQSKWEVVDDVIAERDQQVGELHNELKAFHSRSEALQIELDRTTVERDSLGERLSLSRGELDESRATNHELCDSVQRLDRELLAARGEIEKVLGQKLELERGLDEHQKELLAANISIEQLERNLSELQGRHAEKETAQLELQTALDQQTREIGSLTGESNRLQHDVEVMRAELDSRDAALRSLEQELRDRDSARQSLEEMMSSEASAVVELRQDLDAANQRIRDLEAARDKRDATAGELAANFAELEEKVSSSERCVAEFQATLLAVESDKKALEDLLAAEQERVRALERELGSKQQSVESRQSGAERVASISSNLPALDPLVRIDDYGIEESDEHHEEYDEVAESADEEMLSADELLADDKTKPEHVLLAVNNEHDVPRRYPLDREEITIGRSRSCDICIDSNFVSRVHARIRVNGERVSIEDAGSTNGIRVNSVDVTKRTLLHGDRLQIGNSKFQYLNLSAD